jgi:mono/diheme cytochrome c family protein
MRRTLSLSVCAALLSNLACVAVKPASDTMNPGAPGGPTAPTSQAVAYTDLAPFFATDCFQCHGNGRSLGGYAMDTFPQVMRDVRPGDAASKLVVTTQPSGSMYQYFSGNQLQKADLVFNWVVVYNAQETR